jgi:hypothetical protein
VYEPYYRAGADCSFIYRRLDMYGLYMLGRDNNLLPVDAKGNVIMLPISDTGLLPVKFVTSVPAKFSGFVQADFLGLPWVMMIMRWVGVNSATNLQQNLNQFRVNTALLGLEFVY